MSGYLLVPMAVQAMVVNDAARQLNYRRWKYDYRALEDFDTPEPDPWDDQAANWSGDPSVNGVYLLWTLPAALRRGSHDPAAAATSWPLVPNRWLVLRYSGPLNARQAAGWVVESDYLGHDGTSPYLDPRATRPTQVGIGRRIDLTTGTWSETGTGQLFLTAVAPGNPAFASFQPNIENVFSIHDKLDGIEAGTLAYAVMGWYSDPASDILGKTQAKDFAAALNTLDWALPAGALPPADPPDECVVHGLVRDIAWNPTGPVPAGGRPAGESGICAGLANTSIDALTATVTQQTINSGKAASYDPQLLKAFQYGLLSSLDQQDGVALLADQVQQAGFLRSPGGVRWEITDAPANSPAQAAVIRAQAAPGDEAAWLAALNQAQAAYETAAAELATLQWDLYCMWWKYGRAQEIGDWPTDCSAAQFQAALDPHASASLIGRTAAQLTNVQNLRAAVPHGDTPEQLRTAIKAYATAHHLPDSRVLQAVALASFWQQANPVIVVSGAKTDSQLAASTALACRLASQVVSAITCKGNAITAAQLTVPTVRTAGMPAVLGALIDEFFLIDPDNATAVATQALHDAGAAKDVAAAMADPKAMRGVPPAVALGPWAQPWAPLFLLWQARFCPVPFAAANWNFDGHRYRWTGTGAPVNSQGQLTYHTYSSYSLLTPQAVFTLQRRLDQYAKDNPQAPLAQVDAFIQQADGWDFLSQGLDGLNQQLVLRRPVAVVGPDHKTAVTDGKTMADLVGDADAYLPDPGPTDNPTMASTFQPVRSGLMYLNRLVVVDAFGQTLELVTPTTSAGFRPILDAELLPDKTTIGYEQARMIQLRPRLVQPARLRFDFVSATDDSQVFGPDEGADPVCGWLTLNHLDASLVASSPDGKALGEVRIITGLNDAKVPHWDPAPGSSWTLDAVNRAYPHLGHVIAGLTAVNATTFGDVLQLIDESLWSIVPGGLPDDQTAAVLSGRPLALVRVRAALELNGPALTDPTWPLTFASRRPAVLDYDFPVRIGDADRRGDGLVGYFTAATYTQFNVARMPSELRPGFLAPIEPGNFVTLRPNGEAALLTMLVDPRAPVHAISDILPVSSLSIPPVFVDQAIASMAQYFGMSPALTVVQPGPPPAVAMPTPATRDFTWSWLEPGATTAIRTVPPLAGAAMPVTDPTVRSGWLCLNHKPGES